MIQVERRQSADSYFDAGEKRYFDPIEKCMVVKIYSGDCYVTSAHNEMLVTILGSCVSACIHDPIAKITGINHFLLPGVPNEHGDQPSPRYGKIAMDLLIEKLVAAGANYHALEVKLFGGGNVISNSVPIGGRNVEFVRLYLAQHHLSLKGSDLGGTLPRRIHYYTQDGRVMLRKLHRQSDQAIYATELAELEVAQDA